MPRESSTETYLGGEIHIGRLRHGADLLEGILTLCNEKAIHMGTIQAIGAVSSARVAYYDQVEKKYSELSFPGHYEILSLTGNVSMKDGSPVCHAHIVLGDDAGRAFGGHLVKGCTVFACEVVITAVIGTPLSRGFDETTGLPLWEFVQ